MVVAFQFLSARHVRGWSYQLLIPSWRTLQRRQLSTDLQFTKENPNYFLLKSEPDEFSIHDLKECGEEEWDGVRNFQARNKLRTMEVGDLAYFYHSSCKVPGVVGTMRVVREAAPDITALDPNHKGYDPKSTPENCRWDAVRVRFESKFDQPVTLKELRERAKQDEVIESLSLLKQSRLSVHELTEEQWNAISALAGSKHESQSTCEDVKTVSEPAKYFVIKSNPSKFSINELHKQSGKEACMLYEARSKTELAKVRSMKAGDLALFYHAACSNPGVVGRVKLLDIPQNDPKSDGFILYLRLEKMFPETLTLKEIKRLGETNDHIASMSLITNSRSNAHELTEAQWGILDSMT